MPGSRYKPVEEKKTQKKQDTTNQGLQMPRPSQEQVERKKPAKGQEQQYATIEVPIEWEATKDFGYFMFGVANVATEFAPVDWSRIRKLQKSGGRFLVGWKFADFAEDILLKAGVPDPTMADPVSYDEKGKPHWNKTNIIMAGAWRYGPYAAGAAAMTASEGLVKTLVKEGVVGLFIKKIKGEYNAGGYLVDKYVLGLVVNKEVIDKAREARLQEALKNFTTSNRAYVDNLSASIARIWMKDGAPLPGGAETMLNINMSMMLNPGASKEELLDALKNSLLETGQYDEKKLEKAIERLKNQLGERELLGEKKTLAEKIDAAAETSQTAEAMKKAIETRYTQELSKALKKGTKLDMQFKGLKKGTEMELPGMGKSLLETTAGMMLKKGTDAGMDFFETLQKNLLETGVFKEKELAEVIEKLRGRYGAEVAERLGKAATEGVGALAKLKEELLNAYRKEFRTALNVVKNEAGTLVLAPEVFNNTLESILEEDGMKALMDRPPRTGMLKRIFSWFSKSRRTAFSEKVYKKFESQIETDLLEKGGIKKTGLGTQVGELAEGFEKDARTAYRTQVKDLIEAEKPMRRPISIVLFLAVALGTDALIPKKTAVPANAEPDWSKYGLPP